MALMNGTEVIICTSIVCTTACFVGWLIIDYLDNKSRREAKIEQMREGREDWSAK